MKKVISLDALQRLVIAPLKRLIDKKVEKVDGKGLSTNDFTNEDKEKLANLSSVSMTGDYNDLFNKPEIPSVEGLATEGYVDDVVTGKVDTAVANLVNSAPETLDTLGEIATAMQENENVIDALNSAIGNKVDKIDGMGLSANDYTNEEKEKLSGLKGVPESTGEYNQLVTDETGAVKWEEKRLSYKTLETITWDGNTEGYTYGSNCAGFPSMDLLWYKVSDKVPSLEDIKGNNVVYTLSENAELAIVEAVPSDKNIVLEAFGDNEQHYGRFTFDFIEYPVWKAYPAVFVSLSTHRIGGTAFIGAGVWFLKHRDNYLTSFSWPEIKEIPLPNGAADNDKVLGVVDGQFGLLESEDADDALDLVAEMGVLNPTTDEEGNILTDENGNILTV